MARLIERTETISDSLCLKVRNHCYENLSEFYRRHFTTEEVSYQIFSAGIAGDFVTEEYKKIIEGRCSDVVSGKSD